ncbi:cyclodeaminase/cyclohydrolase family protein [Brotaphodocola sp.]|uniref:cyclodeaminase/cyclohydrolase family protein n=1 Tax=Brotaphodocola sp. TaxID=3073577 RepID=UPI003D7F041B
MIEKQEMGIWIQALASKAPVPGGGGASALGGALAAALGQMVSNLTIGKKRYADVEREVKELCEHLERLQNDLLDLADQDAQVFAPLAAAYSMPTETEEQRTAKDWEMEKNLLAASLVPLQMMGKAMEVLKALDVLEEKGSRMAVSDIGVAAQFARSAVTGAVMNIYINTRSMKDRDKAEELNREADALLRDGIYLADQIYGRVQEKLR